MITKEIYIIGNTVNNKVYIGQTMNGYKVRFKQHTQSALNPGSSQCPKLHNAMRKHGVDNFYIQVLESNVSLEEVDSKETYYIKKYKGFTEGYNTLEFGESRKGYKPSKETRQKMSKASIGRIKPQEAIDKYKATVAKRKATLIKKDNKAIVNINTGKVYKNKYELAEILEVSVATLSRACKNMRNTVKGSNYMYESYYLNSIQHRKREKGILSRMSKNLEKEQKSKIVSEYMKFRSSQEKLKVFIDTQEEIISEGFIEMDFGFDM